MNSDSEQKKLIEVAREKFRQKDYVGAAKICKDLLQKNPRDGVAWNLWGSIIDLTGDNAAALRCFLQAIECNASETINFFNAGLQFLRLGRPREALSYFVNYLEKAPDDALAHQAIGRTYNYLSDFAKSELHFRRSLALDPDNIETYEQLAFALEKMNKTQEATDILTDGFKKAPKHLEFMLVLAQLQRRNKQFDEALKSLEKFIVGFLDKRSLTTPQYLKLSIALSEKGKVLEKKKKWKEAFSAFSRSQEYLAKVYEASKISREKFNNGPFEEYFNNHIQKSTNWLKRAATKDLQSHISTDVKNNLFLVGFPRSGTTLLGNILAAHPDILTMQEDGIIETLMLDLPRLFSGRKIFYPDGLDELSGDDIKLLQQNYFERAKKCLERQGQKFIGQMIVDKMPLNICYLSTIFRLFPAGRVITLIRDPRDVVLSCFFQTFAFNQATEHFLGLEDTAQTYCNVMSLYIEYRKTLPEEYIREVRYEDLTDNFEANIRDILKFAGIGWDERVLEYYKPQNRQIVATPSYEGITEPIYKDSTGKWENYAEQLAPYMHMLEPFVKKFGYHK